MFFRPRPCWVYLPSYTLCRLKGHIWPHLILFSSFQYSLTVERLFKVHNSDLYYEQSFRKMVKLCCINLSEWNMDNSCFLQIFADVKEAKLLRSESHRHVTRDIAVWLGLQNVLTFLDICRYFPLQFRWPQHEVIRNKARCVYASFCTRSLFQKVQ